VAQESSEVYGFVFFVTVPLLFITYLLWAIIPDDVLKAYGVTYFPDKYWAIALPCYLCVAIFLGISSYVGYNLVSTRPPTNISTISDDFAVQPPRLYNPLDDDGFRVAAIYDIPITDVNRAMFLR
jgi:phosphatidylinositol glycan class P protein